MSNFFDNTKEIGIFLKWKMHIITITLSACILGGVISFFIKPKYESIAMAYPTNILPYSDETETEQVLQILQSADIRNLVIKDLNLYEHYKIGPTSTLGRYYINSEWSENVSISRTSTDAIKIRVVDINPIVACDIVNAIVDNYNSFVNDLHKEKFYETTELSSRQRTRKFKMLDSLNQEIKKYNMMGIYDVPLQSKELAAALFKGTGNSAKIAEFQKVFNEHSGDYLIPGAWLQGEVLALQQFIEEYDIAFSRFDRQFTHISIISSPEVAQKKVSPQRLLYAGGFMLSGFLLTVLTIACIEAYRKSKKVVISE